MLKATKYILFFLLFLFSFSFAVFNASVYLYNNENASRLLATNFTLENNTYSLITIDQKSLFLLKNGGPVQDTDVIRAVLRTHFRQTSYPSQAELDALRQSVLGYNHSMNDGGRFPEMEENSCRQVLLLNGIRWGNGTIYCNSDANCLKVVEVLYSASYAKGIKKTISFEDALRLVKEYAAASDESRSLIRRVLFLLDGINDGNLNSSLSELKSIVPVLRRNKVVLENTIFRTPTTDPAEVRRCINERCFGLCPDISFNSTQLNRMDNFTASLLSRSKPYITYQTVSTEIYSNTVSRFLYRTSETKAFQFSSLFEPLALDAGSVAADGNVALSYISNESLRVRIAKLNDLTTKINRSITIRNFSTIEDDLTEYEETISVTRLMIPDVLETYNQSLTAKNNADALLFILDAKDLNNRDRKRVNELKNTTYALGAAFSQGLTDEQLTQMSFTYANMSQEANLLLKAQKEGIFSFASTKFRSFARRINFGLASLASATKLSSPADFISNKLVYLGGVSLLTFLSFASLSFFGFLGIYSRFRLAGNAVKLALAGGYALFILGLLLFSALFYIMLNKTAAIADLEEFIYDLAPKSSSAVVVDIKGVPHDSITSMRSCANLIAGNLRANNKSVSTYELDFSACSVTRPGGEIITMERGQCNSELRNSSAFILSYSTVPVKPVLSAIYDTKAFVYGDNSYYKACIISTLFK